MEKRKRRFYHGVRFKLLLVSLTLLAIPWAGYRYIEETESFLRRAQENVLLGTAQAIATVLHNRRELFDRNIQLRDTIAVDSSLYVHRLSTPIQLDGYKEDWTDLLDQTRRFGAEHRIQGTDEQSAGGLAFDYLAGTYRGYLYVLLQVTDDQVVYRGANSRRLDRNDYLEIILEQPDASLARYLLATFGPGWVSAHRMSDDPQEPYPLRPEVRIKGEWQETADGYTLEIRIPESLIGRRLAFAVGDIDDPRNRGLRSLVATSGTKRLDDLGILVTPSPEIQKIIDSLEHENAQIWVLDRDGRVLAQKGHLQSQSQSRRSGDNGEIGMSQLLHALYRLVLPSPVPDVDSDVPAASRLQGSEIKAALAGNSDTRRRLGPEGKGAILSAAQPIRSEQGLLGAVVVEQSTNDIVSIQNQALERLFTVTLMFFAGTSLVLLGFATRLTTRIRRLRNRVEAAVAPDGRILGEAEPTAARDEIGDLGRSFSSVLRRLTDYNRYLEHMASRLAHEFRTPLTVVKTSLDNLEMASEPDTSQRYLERARAGADRLTLILSRLREATRLEQMLEQAECERFDLCDFVSVAAENYRSVYPDIGFITRIPPEPVAIYGAPELLSQALDNLVSNAVDFRTGATSITLQIAPMAGTTVKLSVCNQGQPLPTDMRQDLFKSMVSVREGESEEPHLGLGLYLVHLIAEFHRGGTLAANLEDGSGTEVGLILPIVRP